MRRCALPPPLSQSQITLSAEASHYLIDVLRMGEEKHFIGFDRAGSERIFKIQRHDGEWFAVAAGPLYQGRCGAPVILCFATPKGEKLEPLARQITEMGISALHLWQAERSVGVWKRDKVDHKLSRLSRVTREASRQSGRADDLSVSPPTSLSEIIHRHQAVPLKLFFDPEAEHGWPKEETFRDLIDEAMHQGLPVCALLVGPEGGISAEEKTQLLEHDWSAVRLNSPVLRTETAGVVVCSLALDRLGFLA